MKTNLRSCIRMIGVLHFVAICLPVPATPLWDFVLTESDWVAPNIIRVPFTLTGTLITVRARVDTVEGNFFFDSGAGRLLLNYRHFANRSGFSSEAGGGVTGKVRVMGSTRVDTLRMDNLLAGDLSAELIDLSHIERAKKTDLVGLIGYEVFKDYEILFDYEASVLLLVRTDEKGNPFEPVPTWEYRPLGSFGVQVVGHVAVVRLKFGDKGDKNFALDSGAEQNLLSNGAGSRFLKAHFEIVKRVKLKGAGQTGIEVLSGSLQHAHLDTFQFRPMATLLTNLSEINATYETNVDGILGYEFLSQRPVGINYKKRRLTLYEKIRP